MHARWLRGSARRSGIKLIHQVGPLQGGWLSGLLAWRDIIYAAMRLQSLNAVGQAGLMIGAENVIRVDAPASEEKIAMDDWRRAAAELPGAAEAAVAQAGRRINEMFFGQTVVPYEPVAAQRA